MNKDIKMTSSRPYLLRAIYQWIADNSLTPYILVDATSEEVKVPTEHINNGKIILNISPTAVMELDMGDDAVSFNARFSGKPMYVHAPVKAVLAIYAKENGRGMVFTEEDDGGAPEPSSKKSRQPNLRVVK
ncbi:ClpXP protease specificity-enhancing factor [Kaarinaea lacus]